MNLHVIVFTDADVVVVVVVAIVLVTLVAMAAFVAGHAAGVRAQRAATQRRARADMNGAVAMFRKRSAR